MCWWKCPSDFLLGPYGTCNRVAFSWHWRWICQQSRFSMLYFLSLSFVRVIPQDPENHGTRPHHDTIHRERRAGLSPIYQLCCKDKQACWYPVWKCVFPSNYLWEKPLVLWGNVPMILFSTVRYALGKTLHPESSLAGAGFGHSWGQLNQTVKEREASHSVEALLSSLVSHPHNCRPWGFSMNLQFQ